MMLSRSCPCGLTAPTTLGAAGFLARLFEQFLDELTGLHLVEARDASTEELLREFLDVLLGEAALADDAEDEAPLAIRAVPSIAVSGGCGSMAIAIPVSISVGDAGAVAVV